MDVRLINNDAASLPANFALVEGKSFTEAFKNMAAVFQAPGKNLAVWNGAADLIDPDSQTAIRDFVLNDPVSASFQRVDSKSSHDHDLPSRAFFRRREISAQLDRHFCEMVNFLHGTFAVEWNTRNKTALRLWRQSTAQMVNAFDEEYGPINHIWVSSRFKKPAPEPRYHVDYSRRLGNENGAILIRCGAGPTTLFVDDADRDIAIPTCKCSQDFNFNASGKTLWALEPWACAVLPAMYNGLHIVHTEPFDRSVKPPSRIAELVVLKTKNRVGRDGP